MPTFPTPGPVALRIRNGAGRVEVQPVAGLTESVVELTAINDAGARAIDSATIAHHGDTIVVEIPDRHGLLGRSPSVAVDIRVPTASTLEVNVGSADLVVGDGLAGLSASSGSGDVIIGAVGGDAEVRSGSGDVTVGTTDGRLLVRTGSGDVDVAGGATEAALSTGSGDVRITAATGATATKTGSGDVTIATFEGELEAKSGSGSTRIDRATHGALRIRTASGDVTVGVATGTAAWLDLDSLSGRIDQQLEERSAPADDQPRLAISATTVSGDIAIRRT